MVDVYFSERRNCKAAEHLFKHVIGETGVKPRRVTTDKSTCFPPTLRQALPVVDHRCSRYLINGLERDHGHLKQRLRSMRGFKKLASADTIARGHALMRNLRNGFSTLTANVPRPPTARHRLATTGGCNLAQSIARHQVVCPTPERFAITCPLVCNRTILDFENIALGDPAQDFATQLYLGKAIANRALGTYRALGGDVDAHFLHRMRRFWELREAVMPEDPAEFEDQLPKLRAGPVLKPFAVITHK